MLRRVACCLLLACALLAGCAESPDDVDPDAGEVLYVVSGTFAEDVEEAQWREAGQLVQDRGGEFLLMESFPLRFQGRDLTESACEAVQAALAAKPYVTDVGSCRVQSAVVDPDEPTSSG